MQFVYCSLRVSPRNLRAVRVRPVSFGRVGNPLVAFLLILLPHVVGAARFAPRRKASAPRRVLVVFSRRLVMAAFRASHRRPLTRHSSGRGEEAAAPLNSAIALLTASSCSLFSASIQRQHRQSETGWMGVIEFMVAPSERQIIQKIIKRTFWSRCRVTLYRSLRCFCFILLSSKQRQVIHANL